MGSTRNTDTPVGLTDQQQAWITDLRALTDFLEAHPALIPSIGLRVLRPVNDAEAMRSVTRGAGHWTKSAYGDWFNLERQIGVHSIDVYARRENVCERRVTGTKTVEIPDPEVMKSVPLVTVEEDVVEWVCPPSLLAEGRS